MEHQGSVTNWLDQLKQGEADDLQQQLWNRYFEQLVQLARSHLQKDLCRVEDEEDAVLSALNSFFVRLEAGQFPNLNDRTSLWPLLVNITLCKTRNLYRRQSAQKRDIRRTVSGTSNEDEENWNNWHRNPPVRNWLSKPPRRPIDYWPYSGKTLCVKSPD